MGRPDANDGSTQRADPQRHHNNPRRRDLHAEATDRKNGKLYCRIARACRSCARIWMAPVIETRSNRLRRRRVDMRRIVPLFVFKNDGVEQFVSKTPPARVFTS
jgi:hypothetical protein